MFKEKKNTPITKADSSFVSYSVYEKETDIEVTKQFMFVLLQLYHIKHFRYH